MKDGGFDTKAVHAGEPKLKSQDPVILPIYQSCMYITDGVTDSKQLKYIRLNNTPNHVCVAEKIAALEGTEAAVVMASGMAAISTSLLALLNPGDHVLAQDSLYGGALHFFKENFPALGRTASYFPLDKPSTLESLVRPETKAIYVESISNPLLRVPDLAAIAAFAKKRGLITFIDNTFPSPVNFNPADLGYDVILHSATKYLNGHSDVVAGCVTGKRVLVDKVHQLLNYMGAALDPHACFLLNRGLKTLGVRVRAQNASALKLAQAMESFSAVERVIYPGLTSHLDHRFARELFSGFGGMLSFEYRGDVDQLDAALRRMHLPAIAPSLGGPETLVTRPVTTSHSWISKEERIKLGIKDTLVRVSVGLEDTDDLIEDFKQALQG